MAAFRKRSRGIESLLLAYVGAGCLDNAKRRDLPATPVERDVVADLLQVDFGVKCARIHFARSLAILVYLRSRRS